MSELLSRVGELYALMSVHPILAAALAGGAGGLLMGMGAGRRDY